MSLPIKIAIGALGSGAVAVGGYEVVAANTNLPRIFGSEEYKKTSEEENRQTTLSSQITKLLTELQKGCAINVWGESNQINVTSATNLESFYKTLTTVDQSCKTSRADKKEIFLKQSSSGGVWSLMSTTDQIQSLVTSSTFKCEVKIKTISIQDPVVWSSANLEENDLEKLLTKLKSIKESKCGSAVSGSSKSILILHKDSEHNQTVFLTEKEWVDAWIKKTSGFNESSPTCSLKIFVSGNPKAIEETDDLTGLHSFLSTTTVTGACTSSDSQDNPKDVVVQKEAGQWSLYPNVKQQIEKLISDNTSKCTVKFKLDSSDQVQTLENITNSASLQKLLEKLKELTVSGGECANAPSTGGAKPITLKETITEGNYSWDKENEGSSVPNTQGQEQVQEQVQPIPQDS